MWSRSLQKKSAHPKRDGQRAGRLLYHRAVLPSLVLAAVAAATAPRTLRVDYYHTGNATEERFALDRVVQEPLPFPGAAERPLDETNLGKYFFEVREVASNRVLYSRGFASVYGEWETTAEALRQSRAFSESLRFPAPAAPVQVVLKKRGAGNLFREVWSLVVDPADPTIDDSPPPPAKVVDLAISGPPGAKLDLLLVADGYTQKEQAKFEKDARRLVETLFTYSPFRERRADFNVRGLFVATAQSGISRPLTRRHRRSPVGATYDAFGSERYILSFENRSLRDLASNAPYDALAIVVNAETYGGGGIFNLYATVAADSMWAGYIFVHELGHSLAALADEYFTSDTAYLPAEAQLEPWEPNVTADGRGGKWKHLVTPSAPLPTLWPHEEFSRTAKAFQEQRKKVRAENRPEAAMDALFLAQQKAETALLSSAKYATAIGAFEGANYAAKGLYRSQMDCIMFSRNRVPFCKVCQHGLDRVIDLYAPARSATPRPGAGGR